MAKLVEEVVLDATQAFRTIDQIGSRLSQAASNFGAQLSGAISRVSGATVNVTANVSSIGPQISGAVDAADTEALVTADTADVTADVTGAVDAADTEALVTADASSVTATVTGAVDAAETEVLVTADTQDFGSEIAEASNEAGSSIASTAGLIGGLTTQLGAARGGFGLLASAAAGAGTAIAAAVSADAIIDFTQDAIDSSRDLVESTTKAQQVFKEGFGDIEEFASTSAEAFGIARRDAIELTATFGNLLTGAGLTRGEAKKLSLEIVELGADLASFNNIAIEGVDGSLAKLAAALVGEIEPIRRIGITFNAAQVEAEAFRLGLQNQNGTLDQSAKILARWSLIQQQAVNAQGDFARTSDNLANQQRILTAQIRNIVAEIGGALLPVVLDLVSAVRDSLPALEDLAEAFIQIVESGISILVPLLETLAVVARTLGPVLTVLANSIALIGEGIASIPPPVIIGVLAAAFISLKAATAFVGRGIDKAVASINLVTPAAEGAARSTGLLSTALSSINPITAAVTAATIGLTLALGAQAKTREAERADIAATREALQLELRSREEVMAATEEQAAILKGLSTETQKFILTNEESEFVSNDQIDDLEKLGVTAERLQEMLQRGGTGIEDFVKIMLESGELTLGAGVDIEDAFRGIEDAMSGKMVGRARSLHDALNVLFNGNEDLVESFIEEEERLNDLSEAYVKNENRLANITEGTTGFTDAQVEQALRMAEAETGVRSYSAAAEILNTRIGEVVERTGEATVEQGVLLNQLDKTPLKIEQSAAAWNALGTAIGEGKVDAEDFNRIAKRFGVTEEVITNFAAASTEALDEFAESLGGNLVRGEDIIGEFVSDMESASADVAKAQEDFNNAVGEGQQEAAEKLSAAQQALEDASDPQTFIDNVNKQKDAILGFKENIQALLDAELPNLAREALEAGPVEGGIFAEMFANAPADIQKFAEESLNALGVANIGFDQFLRTEAAPQLAAAGNFLFTALADQMGIALIPASGTVTEQLNAVIGVFGKKSPEFRAAAELAADAGFQGLSAPIRAEILETLGARGAGAARRLTLGYQKALDAGLVPVTEEAFNKIPIGIRKADNIVAVSAESTGTKAADGFGRKGKFDTQTQTAINSAVRVLDNDTTLKPAGERAGEKAADGFEEGADFDKAAGNAMEKVPNAISESSTGAKITADASGVGIGVSLGTGIASGLATSSIAVTIAINALVATAINAAEEAFGIDSPSRVFARIGKDVTAGMVQGIESGQTDVDAAVGGIATIPDVHVPNLSLEVDLVPNIAALEAALAQRNVAVLVGGSATGGTPSTTVPAVVDTTSRTVSPITFAPTYNLEAPDVPTVTQLEAINRKQGLQIARLGKRA